MTGTKTPAATVRPFAERDYEAIVSVANVALPEYKETVDEVRFEDEHRDPKAFFARFVAEDLETGRVIGTAQHSQMTWRFHPRKFVLDESVHPEWRGRGVGTALFEAVMDSLRLMDPLVVRAHTRSDLDHSLRFLARHGFAEEYRDWESRLDLSAFDPTAYDAEVQQTLDAGIVIKSLADLRGEPDVERRIYEAVSEMEADVPYPDPATPIGLEQFRERMLNNPGLFADGYLMAIDSTDGSFVGHTALWKSEQEADLFTGLTAVKRSHRRGIALALKITSLAWAKQQGVGVVRTWNNSQNRPMLSINERLGFAKQPAWIGFAKEL